MLEIGRLSSLPLKDMYIKLTTNASMILFKVKTKRTYIIQYV
jgi:hypothetical protein